jgi:uncharacterized protein YcbK (DUF882 family)
MKYSKNFSRYEFYIDEEDGNYYDIMTMRLGFIEKLQKLRDVMGEPIGVTHGLRSWFEQFYDICGGDEDKYYESEHQFGNAADIWLCKRQPSIYNMLELGQKAIQVGFKRVGFYPYSNVKFIHVDMCHNVKSESWIRNEQGRYAYYLKFDEAISEILLNVMIDEYK